MKEEELKKEIEPVLIWIREDGEQMCTLPTKELGRQLSISDKKAELKGFQAGQLAERERCLKMIEEYLDEGYDRMRDDKATENCDETKVESINSLMECEGCKELFNEDELDLIDGEWLCCDCEKELRGLK